MGLASQKSSYLGVSISTIFGVGHFHVPDESVIDFLRSWRCSFFFTFFLLFQKKSHQSQGPALPVIYMSYWITGEIRYIGSITLMDYSINKNNDPLCTTCNISSSGE